MRCTLPSGTKLFVLPSKYLMQKQEQMIVEEAGGYTKLDDGCGFEVDWQRKIKEELELKGHSGLLRVLILLLTSQARVGPSHSSLLYY